MFERFQQRRAFGGLLKAGGKIGRAEARADKYAKRKGRKNRQKEVDARLTAIYHGQIGQSYLGDWVNADRKRRRKRL